METAQDRIAEARNRLAREVEHSSLRAVAERVGIDHSTLGTFVRGEVRRPKAKVLEPILAYVEKRAGSGGSAERPLPVNPESSPDFLDDDGGWVRMRATTLAYWRGRFDTMAEWMRAIDGLMQSQRDQFAQFTRGVSEFRESGVLPAPAVTITPPVTPPPMDPESAAALWATLDEMVRQHRASQGASAPAADGTAG